LSALWEEYKQYVSLALEAAYGSTGIATLYEDATTKDETVAHLFNIGNAHLHEYRGASKSGGGAHAFPDFPAGGAPGMAWPDAGVAAADSQRHPNARRPDAEDPTTEFLDIAFRSAKIGVATRKGSEISGIVTRCCGDSAPVGAPPSLPREAGR
jgi:hypothetical protein